MIDSEVATSVQLRAADRNPHRTDNRLGDRPLIGRVKAAIGFDELKLRARAVAGADWLIQRGDGIKGRAGKMIEPVAPAKAIKLPAPLLEKRDHIR